MPAMTYEDRLHQADVRIHEGLKERDCLQSEIAELKASLKKERAAKLAAMKKARLLKMEIAELRERLPRPMIVQC